MSDINEQTQSAVATSEQPQLESLQKSDNPKKPKKPKQQFQCKYCDKQLFSKQNLTYHENAGICMKSLVMCGRCLKPFPFDWQLKRHQTAIARCEVRNNVQITRNGNAYIVTVNQPNTVVPTGSIDTNGQQADQRLN